MVLADFRTKYPEFASYSDDLIQDWGIVAETLLPQRKWTTLWKKATFLYTAHQVALSPKPDKFDHQQVTKGDKTFWNRTEFGQELQPLIKIFGI